MKSCCFFEVISIAFLDPKVETAIFFVLEIAFMIAEKDFFGTQLFPESLSVKNIIEF